MGMKVLRIKHEPGIERGNCRYPLVNLEGAERPLSLKARRPDPSEVVDLAITGQASFLRWNPGKKKEEEVELRLPQTRRPRGEGPPQI